MPLGESARPPRGIGLRLAGHTPAIGVVAFGYECSGIARVLAICKASPNTPRIACCRTATVQSTADARAMGRACLMLSRSRRAA
jgi:hypothetical protein